MANKIQLVTENAVYPELSFLDSEARLNDYKERIAKYGEKARETLDVFRFADGVVKGSNPFADVELASADIAMPLQLEHTVRLNPHFFRRCWFSVKNKRRFLRRKRLYCQEFIQASSKKNWKKINFRMSCKNFT